MVKLPSLPRLVAVAALSAVLVAVGACEDETTTPSASGSSTTEPTPLESESEPAAEGGEPMAAADFVEIARAAFARATTARVSMTMGAGVRADGLADYGADPVKMAMTMSMPQFGGEVEMRLVGDAMYMKAPALGTKFVKFDLTDPSNPLSPISDAMDPSTMFESLQKGITAATYHGTEDVDGESMDRYTVTIDTAKMTADLAPELQGGASEVPPSVDYAWWIDGDGLIRRFSADLGPAVGEIGGTFSDWGIEVRIAAPPATKVKTFPGA